VARVSVASVCRSTASNFSVADFNSSALLILLPTEPSSHFLRWISAAWYLVLLTVRFSDLDSLSCSLLLVFFVCCWGWSGLARLVSLKGSGTPESQRELFARARLFLPPVSSLITAQASAVQFFLYCFLVLGAGPRFLVFQSKTSSFESDAS
jgi:hypothetical protein